MNLGDERSVTGFGEWANFNGMATLDDWLGFAPKNHITIIALSHSKLLGDTNYVHILTVSDKNA